MNDNHDEILQNNLLYFKEYFFLFYFFLFYFYYFLFCDDSYECKRIFYDVID